MYLSNPDRLGVFHTDLPKLLIIGPRRMQGLSRPFLTKLIPFFQFFQHFLHLIVGIELFIIHLSDALYHYLVAGGKFIMRDLFRLLEFESEVYARADPSQLRWFEPLGLDQISGLPFRAVVNDRSFWAVSREMVAIVIFADPAEMFSVEVGATNNLTFLHL